MRRSMDLLLLSTEVPIFLAFSKWGVSAQFLRTSGSLSFVGDWISQQRLWTTSAAGDLPGVADLLSILPLQVQSHRGIESSLSVGIERIANSQ
jgi:hypothetical protein